MYCYNWLWCRFLSGFCEGLSSRTPGSENSKPREAPCAVVSGLRHPCVDCLVFHKVWEQSFVQWWMVKNVSLSPEILNNSGNLTHCRLLSYLGKYSKLVAQSPNLTGLFFEQKVGSGALQSPFHPKLFPGSVSSLIGIDHQVRSFWGEADRIYMADHGGLFFS